jgi:hypothetical protein
VTSLAKSMDHSWAQSTKTAATMPAPAACAMCVFTVRPHSRYKLNQHVRAPLTKARVLADQLQQAFAQRVIIAGSDTGRLSSACSADRRRGAR